MLEATAIPEWGMPSGKPTPLGAPFLGWKAVVLRRAGKYPLHISLILPAPCFPIPHSRGRLRFQCQWRSSQPLLSLPIPRLQQAESLCSTSRILLLGVVISPPPNDKHPEHGSGCINMADALIQVYFLCHYFA